MFTDYHPLTRYFTMDAPQPRTDHQHSGESHPQPITPIRSFQWVGYNAAVALLYFITAKASLLIYVSAGPASPIWLPAGLTVAALLILGRRLWPGVFLGAFLSDPMLTPTAAGVIAASSYAAGVTVQALLGATLARAYLDRQALSVIPGREWHFLFSAGPLACLMSPTIGASSRYLMGMLPAENVAQQWLVWWAGDSIGVVLIAPLLLLLWPNSQPGARPRYRLLLPLLMTTILLVAGSLTLSRLELAEARTNFSQQVKTLTELGFLTLKEKISPLYAVQSFFSASEQVTEAEFLRFNKHISNQPHIVRIDWAPRVSADRRQAFETGMREQDTGEFAISTVDQDWQKIRAPAGDDYYPVQFSTLSEDTAFNPLGLDHGQFDDRRRAINTAIRSGEATAKIINLHPSLTDMLVLFIPVLEPENSQTSDRKDVVKGFVLGIIDFRQLFLPLDLAARENQLHYRVTGFSNSGDKTLQVGALPTEIPPAWSQSIRVADQIWRLDMAIGNNAISHVVRWSFIGFSLLAGLLVSFAVLSSRAYQLASYQHHQAMHNSRELLSAIIESADDQVAAVDTEFKLTVFNPAYVEFVQQVFEVTPEVGQIIDGVPPKSGANVEYAGEIRNNIKKALVGAAVKTSKKVTLADQTRVFEVYYNPIISTDGTIIGATRIARDITSQRELEASLQQRLDELRRWQKTTLGRESRTLELKREVNQLLLQMGKTPRYDDRAEIL
jgi:integral membrane sensor domain MASE1/PAS domain-containing protein